MLKRIRDCWKDTEEDKGLLKDTEEDKGCWKDTEEDKGLLEGY
jgi:hypothetical protein